MVVVALDNAASLSSFRLCLRVCPPQSTEVVTSTLGAARSSVLAQDAPSFALHCKVGSLCRTMIATIYGRTKCIVFSASSSVSHAALRTLYVKHWLHCLE